MLRHPHLIPLSRQHHASLALCVRMARAAKSGSFDGTWWQSEFRNHFEEMLKRHFEIEESVVFAAAREQPELAEMVDELSVERAALRDRLIRVCKGQLQPSELLESGKLLSAHIRREESQLFEGCQQYLSTRKMEFMGAEIVRQIREAAPDALTCSLPIEPSA